MLMLFSVLIVQDIRMPSVLLYVNGILTMHIRSLS